MILKRLIKDDVIECLYESSNIVASSYNNKTKDMTITFKKGTQYIYKDVLLRDYTRFELADSQGVVFNSHIKNYKFDKGNTIDIGKLIQEINECKPKEFVKSDLDFITFLKEFIVKSEKNKEITQQDINSINIELGKILTTKI